MATKVVTGKVTAPDGTGKAGVVVRASLSQGAVVSGTSEVPPLTVSATTSDGIGTNPPIGTYSLTLQANNDLTPTGTYYQIDEPGYSFSIVVPQSAGPFIISTIQVNVPPVASPTPSHVTSLVVDTSATVGGLLHTGTLTVDTGPLTLPALSIADSALSANVDLLNGAQTISGVKHFSAAPIFDAGFSVSAGAVSFPANSIADGALSTNVNLLNAIQTVTAVKTHSAAPIFNAGFSVAAGQVGAFGTGDALSLFIATSPQSGDFRAGTSASPDTTLNPLTRYGRTINLATAAVTGDGGEQASALLAIASGTAANQVQPVGGRFGAISASGSAADVSAIYGTGINNGSGVAIGGTFAARAVGAGSHPSAGQFASANLTGSDFTVSASGFSGGGLWVVASGANKSGAGLEFGNPFSAQFRAAIHLNSQNGGPADLYSFLDDGSAANSIAINGTHSSGAIVIAAGSGTLVMGATTPGFSPALLEVRATTGTAAFSPLVVISHPDSNGQNSLRIRNGSGSSDYFASGNAGNFITGSVAGDTGIVINTANKFWMVGPSGGYVLRVGQANSIDVGNSTAVLNYNYAVTALGGGAAPTLGTIGGSGPATAAQNSWLKVNIAGTASYIPVWR